MPVFVDASVQVQIYSIESELKSLELKREANRRLTESDHKLMFHPKEWARHTQIDSLDDFRLSDDQLLKIGQQVTKI